MRLCRTCIGRHGLLGGARAAGKSPLANASFPDFRNSDAPPARERFARAPNCLSACPNRNKLPAIPDSARGTFESLNGPLQIALLPERLAILIQQFRAVGIVAEKRAE